jgi:hypothetical protein
MCVLPPHDELAWGEKGMNINTACVMGAEMRVGVLGQKSHREKSNIEKKTQRRRKSLAFCFIELKLFFLHHGGGILCFFFVLFFL